MDESNPIPAGLCQCGCGGKTTPAPITSRARGLKKGEPARYMMGHANRTSGQHYAEQDCGYDTPCWVWQLYRDKNGYGRLSVNEVGTSLAHVVYWVRANGPTPDQRELDHLCRNTGCVRPEHLEPVTHAENLRRARGTKLTAEMVAEIRAGDTPTAELARRWGISVHTLYGAKYGKTWKVLDHI